MPFVHYPAHLPALLVGLKVKILILINEPIGRQGDVCLDTRLSDCLSRGIRIVIQVGHGGDAKPQALRNAHQRRGFGTAVIHFGLPGQLLGQRLLTAIVIQIAAQGCSRQMGMAVHKTRDGYHAGTVHNGIGLFLRCGFAYVRDFTLRNANICPKEHLHFFIHGDHCHIGNQGIQRYTLPFNFKFIIT